MDIKHFKNGCLLITLTSFLFHTACGTILYPERKGQKAGRLDPAIVILDGIGLLLFIVPGVIAFAVDFSNGTIYLPGGKNSFIDQSNYNQKAALAKMQVIIVKSEKLTEDQIETVVKDYTGKTIDLHNPNVQITKLTHCAG